MNGMTRCWKLVLASSVMVGGVIAYKGDCALGQVAPFNRIQSVVNSTVRSERPISAWLNISERWTFIDIGDLGKPLGCAAGGKNEFIITGRGGLPPNPYQPLDSSEVWRDVQLPRELAENSTGVSRTSTSPTMTRRRIMEATGWIVNENGNVELVANVSTAISQERCELRSSTKIVNTDQLFVLE